MACLAFYGGAGASGFACYRQTERGLADTQTEREREKKHTDRDRVHGGGGGRRGGGAGMELRKPGLLVTGKQVRPGLLATVEQTETDSRTNRLRENEKRNTYRQSAWWLGGGEGEGNKQAWLACYRGAGAFGLACYRQTERDGLTNTQTERDGLAKTDKDRERTRDQTHRNRSYRGGGGAWGGGGRYRD